MSGPTTFVRDTYTSNHRRLSVMFPTAHSILSQPPYAQLHLTLQKTYWSLLLFSAGITLLHPPLHTWIWDLTGADLDRWYIGRLTTKAYNDGNVPLAAGLTFGVNLLAGGMGTINLPCVLVPFSGVVLAGYRAMMWGCLFAPVKWAEVSLPHLVTVAMEGQAYILASVGAWVWSKGLVADLKGLWTDTPRRNEMATPAEKKERQKGEAADVSNKVGEHGDVRDRWAGVKEGWRVTKGLYGLMSAILAVSALWEAVEVIYWPVSDKV